MKWILAGVLVLSGCTKKTEVIETVGDYEITRELVEFRDQVTRVYYPSYSDTVGHKQLKEAFQQAMVLKKYNRPVSNETLEQESERINKESLMPEMLAKIKAVYKGDHQAYLHSYVLPVYVQRVLYYDLFLNSPQIHQATTEQAQTLIREIKAQPQKIKQIAERSNLKVVDLLYSKDQGLRPAELSKRDKDVRAPQAPNNAAVEQKLKETQAENLSKEAKAWEEIFSSLRAGDVYSKPIDQGTSLLVLRFVGAEKNNPGVRRCQAIHLPKRDFQEWFAQEAKN